jgi:hypothetical protein
MQATLFLHPLIPANAGTRIEGLPGAAFGSERFTPGENLDPGIRRDERIMGKGHPV